MAINSASQFSGKRGINERNSIVSSQLVSSRIKAIGGTETTITVSGVRYRVHTFTGTGNFIPYQPLQVEYLIVGGGGGAGGGRGGYTPYGAWSGGGGAGGMLTGSTIISVQNYTVTVGAGGAVGTENIGNFNVAGNGKSGDNSTALGLTAYGGGGGGNSDTNGNSGGSGGGGGGDTATSGGSGTVGQGNSGGNGEDPAPERAGGGGGAGQAGYAGNDGTYPRRGGDGLQSSISGTATYYAGGGGGGGGTGGVTTASGGLGGGGTGGGGYTSVPYNLATPGSTNTGGGGGGEYLSWMGWRF